MDTAEDDLFELIARLDPTRSDEPPVPGSERHRSILAAATSSPVDAAATVRRIAEPVPTAHPRRHGWRRVVGIAAAGLVAVGAVVTWRAGDDQTAAAALRSAAEALGDVSSFEGERLHVEPGVRVETNAVRVDRDDFEYIGETRFENGHVDRVEVTVVDQVEYHVEDGRTIAIPRATGDYFEGSYGAGSVAVVDALLTGADVTETGSETIAGVPTTRYDVALTERSVDAISALSEDERRWFDLEDAVDVDRLTVWVAGDYIHRIEITHSDGASTRTTFSNVNGDITITPPPGPYVDQDGG